MEHRLIARIKRSLAGGVIVAGLVAALVLTGHAPAEAAEVDTVPSAEPGGVVLVTGTADSVGLEQVRLCWDKSGCANLGAVRLGLLQPSYSTNVTIPDTAPVGVHDIYACTSLSCASASIEVVAPGEPTTTTTLASPTTPPAPAPTTPSPPPTTTSTTRPSATSVPQTTVPPATTATGGAPRNASAQISTGIGAGDATPVEVADLTITSAADSDPEETEQLASTDTTLYQPPTPASSTSTSPSTTLTSDRDSRVIEVAVSQDDGLSYDPRLVFWTLWLLVMVVTGGLVSTVWWLSRRR